MKSGNNKLPVIEEIHINGGFLFKETITTFDFENIKNKDIEHLKAGNPLLGKNDAFALLLESILNAALKGKMKPILQKKNISWIIGVMIDNLDGRYPI